MNPRTVRENQGIILFEKKMPTEADAPYVKLERVGHGSFGEVYKGYSTLSAFPVIMTPMASMNRVTGELVAIKILDLEASDDDLSEIQKEINVLSTCDSEYITRYHASILVDTKLWIVMDYGASSQREHHLNSNISRRWKYSQTGPSSAHATSSLHCTILLIDESGHGA